MLSNKKLLFEMTSGTLHIVIMKVISHGFSHLTIFCFDISQMNEWYSNTFYSIIILYYSRTISTNVVHLPFANSKGRTCILLYQSLHFSKPRKFVWKSTIRPLWMRLQIARYSLKHAVWLLNDEKITILLMFKIIL